MVEDDHRDAALFERLDSLDVLRSAVDDDHQVAAALRDRGRDVIMQSVALIETVRDEIADMGPAHKREFHRDRRRGDAVDVIVAVDYDVGGVGQPTHQFGRFIIFCAQVELLQQAL